jgi:type III pantothenate kinase
MRNKEREKLLLAVDVGNTLIKLGVFRKGKIVADFQLATDRDRTPDELGLQIKGLLEGLGARPEAVRGVIISSVVPHLNWPLEQAFKRHLGNEPAFLDYRWGLIELAVEEPSKVGNDRIAACLAGYAQHGGPLLVIHFGTATTFNLVSKTGAFLGGAIAPQMEMAAKALAQHAALLYEVELNPPRSVIGKTTDDNIKAGFVFGFIDLVRGLIARYRDEIDEPQLKVIATGGWGKFFTKHVSEIFAYDPHLALKGLQIAWERRNGESPSRLLHPSPHTARSGSSWSGP